MFWFIVMQLKVEILISFYCWLKYGVRLGDGSLARKVHFGVYDLVAALVLRYWQVSDDMAKVDESESFG